MTYKKYLSLSVVFLMGYLVIEFTDIYGNPGWFKFYLVIIGVTFLISGISEYSKTKK